MKSKLLFFLSLLPGLLLAQTTGKISGKIIDEKKEPVIGVNVLIDGTAMGAAASVEGEYFIINIPPGTYSLKASAVGYGPKRIDKVKVEAGLTTRVNFTMQSTMIEMPEVVIQYTRPAVQKDLTSKMQGMDLSDIEMMPAQMSIRDLFSKQAGITRDISTTPVNSQPVFGQFATIPNDGLHFRGGRTNETLYLFDGITVNDGLWGGYNLDVLGQYTLQSLQTLTGTFGPQYGEAMSGVILMQPQDNLASRWKAQASLLTDNFGKKSGSQKEYNLEAAVSGPIPGVKNLTLTSSARTYTTDGYINGYLYPNWVDSRGTDKSGIPETVPMVYRDTRMAFGKAIWQVSKPLKLRLGYYAAETKQGVYDHFFKYNPYGTPRVVLNDYLGYLKLTHVFSPRTFADFALSKYRRGYRSRVFSDLSLYEVRPEILTAEFSVAGENYVYFDSYYDKIEAQGSFNSQVSRQHFITSGASLSTIKTSLQRRNPNGGEAYENYYFQPRKMYAFVNDKMEFDDIGMVINVGLRYDYIDPNREFVEDIESPDGKIGKVKAHQYVSPRFGISYPISDAAAFRFGYGHYYQYPDFYKAFQGTNREYSMYPAPNVNSVQGAIAKGDIQEEKTINYEFGVQMQLAPKLSADITGFYRKTSNLIGIVIAEGYLTSGDVVKAQKYPIFDNINFATVKGVEFSMTKRMSDNFTGFLNYTYSRALVSSSLVFSQAQDLARTFPADWDQSHVLSFGVTMEFPAHWGYSLMGGLSSGFPYTFNVLMPNAERSPTQSSLDAMLFKELTMAKVTARLYGQVSNLLNHKNVWWVYADSGQPGVDTNETTSDDYTNNPAMWGPGRRYQIGLNFTIE
ncbi:MAG TPA: TonB-dependent receptor [bacterium]|nr:TonB-dependent receptor [bacterium]